jgi:hypothetical protein
MSKTHYKFESKTIWTGVTENHVKGKCLPSQSNKVTGLWQWQHQQSLAISGHGSSPLGLALDGWGSLPLGSAIGTALDGRSRFGLAHIVAVFPMGHDEDENDDGWEDEDYMQDEPGLEAMPQPGELRFVDLQPVVLPVKAAATGPQAYGNALITTLAATGPHAYGNALITTLTRITAAMRAAFITTSTRLPAAMRAMGMLPLFYSESEDVFPVVSEMRCKFGSKTISTDVCIPGPEAMPSPWAMQPGVALVEAAATASPAFDRLQRLLN